MTSKLWAAVRGPTRLALCPGGAAVQPISCALGEGRQRRPVARREFRSARSSDSAVPWSPCLLDRQGAGPLASGCDYRSGSATSDERASAVEREHPSGSLRPPRRSTDLVSFQGSSDDDAGSGSCIHEKQERRASDMQRVPHTLEGDPPGLPRRGGRRRGQPPADALGGGAAYAPASSSGTATWARALTVPADGHGPGGPPNPRRPHRPDGPAAVHGVGFLWEASGNEA
jgi:hypothetical protein